MHAFFALTVLKKVSIVRWHLFFLESEKVDGVFLNWKGGGELFKTSMYPRSFYEGLILSSKGKWAILELTFGS